MKLLVLDWIAHADIINRMRERGKQNTTSDIGLGSQCKIFVETVGVEKRIGSVHSEWQKVSTPGARRRDLISAWPLKNPREIP